TLPRSHAGGVWQPAAASATTATTAARLRGAARRWSAVKSAGVVIRVTQVSGLTRLAPAGAGREGLNSCIGRRGRVRDKIRLIGRPGGLGNSRRKIRGTNASGPSGVPAGGRPASARLTGNR